MVRKHSNVEDWAGNVHVGQKIKRVLVAGEVAVHFQSTTEAPLSKVANLLMFRGSCDNLPTCPRLYPGSTNMKLG